MFRHKLLQCGLAAVLMVLPVIGWSGVLSNFTAIYQVERESTPLGRARFTLSPQGENCYLYQGIAKPEGLAALIAGETVEQSHFCIAGGKIRPVTYRTSEDGGKGDNYTLTFDWINRLVRISDAASRKLPAEGVDPLSLQIAVRKILSDAGSTLPTGPMELVVIEDDKEKTYTFRIVGREELKTPIGNFNAVRVDRVDDPKRQLRMWLAPSLDYLPVQVEQQRRKGAVMRLRIETLPDSPAD
jgi:hypothetical protein